MNVYRLEQGDREGQEAIPGISKSTIAYRDRTLAAGRELAKALDVAGKDNELLVRVLNALEREEGLTGKGLRQGTLDVWDRLETRLKQLEIHLAPVDAPSGGQAVAAAATASTCPAPRRGGPDAKGRWNMVKKCPPFDPLARVPCKLKEDYDRQIKVFDDALHFPDREKAVATQKAMRDRWFLEHFPDELQQWIKRMLARHFRISGVLHGLPGVTYREADEHARAIRDFWGLSTPIPTAADVVIGLRLLAEWCQSAGAELRCPGLDPERPGGLPGMVAPTGPMKGGRTMGTPNLDVIKKCREEYVGCPDLWEKVRAIEDWRGLEPSRKTRDFAMALFALEPHPGILNGFSWRQQLSSWIREYERDLAARRKGRREERSRSLVPAAPGQTAADKSADTGEPFYKPKYFDQWIIGAELLRKNATDHAVYTPGRVRRVRKTSSTGAGKRPVYWYSWPDACKRWPDRIKLGEEKKAAGPPDGGLPTPGLVRGPRPDSPK
jgi:hypothetical protein